MLTLLVSIIILKPFKDKDWKFIQLLLLLNLFCEFISNYLWYQLHLGNAAIYNIVSLYNFVIWILIIGGKRTSKFIFLFVGIAIVNLFFIQKLNHFNSYTFLFGTIITTWQIICFFYNNFIILQNDLEVRLYKITLFAGILIYHLGLSTVLFVQTWGATTTYLFPKFTVYQLISYIVNTFFYGLLLVSIFLYKRDIKK